jgi:NADH-quinone oxidoreductase subunit M
MGFVTLGFFIFNDIGVFPVVLVQMIAHGFVSGAMFLCIGVLYDRVHSRDIATYGGVVNTMPQVFGLCFALCHGQLWPARPRPGLSANGWSFLVPSRLQLSGWASPGRIGADFWRSLHPVDVQAGLSRSGHQRRSAWQLEDINSREFLMLALLAVATLYMGVYPKPFTDVMDPSVLELLKHVAQSKLVG